MARKVVLLDDLTNEVIDDSLGGGTIKFSVDDEYYSIDLGVKNTSAFHKDLQKWIDAATKEEPAPRVPTRVASAKSGGTRAASGSGMSKEQLQAVRDWASKEGIEVSPRGRISREVLDKYEAAHESKSATKNVGSESA